MSEKIFLCKSLLFNGLWISQKKSENNSLPFPLFPPIFGA